MHTQNMKICREVKKKKNKTKKKKIQALLRSRQGESAYIIEHGWNLVVNRPQTSGCT